jgi:glutamine amidotransferase
LIAIVDYGMGNQHSVLNALRYLGVEAAVTADPDTVRRADRVILPGVGAFGAAMENLNRTGLRAAMNEAVLQRGRPFLGICLGMQLVAAKGTEKGLFEGLGWIDGEVRLMTPTDAGLKLPHVGWNDIVLAQDLPLFQGLKKERAFYFVHSYAICPENPAHVAATCDYGGAFVAAVYRDNIFATQFHPEKSQKNGLTILENFAEWEGGPC